MKKPFTIKITPDLLEALRELAKRNRRTVTAEIEIALESHLGINRERGNNDET